MPIHDWTRVNSGTFHDFHEDWTIEIRRTLNRGILPPGYFAMADQRVIGLEPDVLGLKLRESEPKASGGLAILDVPPKAKQISRVETDRSAYARKANRISIQHPRGNVVAIIEIVSPGNKDTRDAVESFVAKAVHFLNREIGLVIIDLFPPGPRDPEGIHQLIWDRIVGTPFERRPEDKPLTVASYDVGDGLTAYVNPVAVGDALPDAPLFLAPGWYVNIPLEATYNASWEETPQPIRDLVESP